MPDTPGIRHMNKIPDPSCLQKPPLGALVMTRAHNQSLLWALIMTRAHFPSLLGALTMTKIPSWGHDRHAIRY